ncbi:unnamed protein product [Ectocarpus sp. 4 AP-2014]
MSSDGIKAMLKENVAKMNQVEGFDVVVVCTNNDPQATYWQQRLEAAKGSSVAKDATVLAVYEDWAGGAGNALGTLYAYQKATALAESKGYDLAGKMKAGEISVGLYHTAGKGTRLAPMPGSENNNKPGVKLAVTADINGKPSPLTILESVVKQTGVYGKSRKGRLSVFWGDQVFIPSVGVEYESTHHADILCTLGPMMNETEWKEKGLDNYGLIAVNSEGNAAQVEKVSHAVATRLLSSLGEIVNVGASLGSFSMSSLLVDALIEEFKPELTSKVGKLDSDPHLWMPFTLEESAYVEIMGGKGTSAEEALAHYKRMRGCLDKFMAKSESKSMGVFGAVNVGDEACWWDYGQLRLYRTNNALLTGVCEESALLREFLGCSSRVSNSDIAADAEVDDVSMVSASTLGGGSVKNSALTNVRCGYIEAEDCILVNVTAKRIVAPRGSIIYNIVDTSSTGVGVGEGGVMVGVHAEDGSQQPIWSNTDTLDGGKVWKKKCAGNPMTFESIYNSNHTTDVFAVESARSKASDEAWAKLSSA